jgi:hypothetical protein
MRGRTVHSGAVRDPQAEPAAVRDAQAIAARVAADEAAADAARSQYQIGPLPTLDADAEFAALALPGEVLHVAQPNAVLEWMAAGGVETLRPAAPLYITSGRLLHGGTQTLSLSLDQIEEMAVALERLLLVRLRDGTDVAVETDGPRLLRVQIAAAVAATRATGAAQPSGQPASQPAG